MENSFEKGQLIVYPAHGVGVVVGVDMQSISGCEMQFVVIYFEKEKMTVRLPINSSLDKKIRKLCSKEKMADAIALLKTPTKTKKMMWSRRAQEYEAKINTGDPVSIAQVVRDLHRSPMQPEHSYSERQIYQEALDRLIREYAAVEDLEIEMASKKLFQLLEAA